MVSPRIGTDMARIFFRDAQAGFADYYILFQIYDCFRELFQFFGIFFEQIKNISLGGFRSDGRQAGKFAY